MFPWPLPTIRAPQGAPLSLLQPCVWGEGDLGGTLHGYASVLRPNGDQSETLKNIARFDASVATGVAGWHDRVRADLRIDSPYLANESVFVLNLCRSHCVSKRYTETRLYIYLNNLNYPQNRLWPCPIQRSDLFIESLGSIELAFGKSLAGKTRYRSSLDHGAFTRPDNSMNWISRPSWSSSDTPSYTRALRERLAWSYPRRKYPSL
jgi:hypothetical protein